MKVKEFFDGLKYMDSVTQIVFYNTESLFQIDVNDLVFYSHQFANRNIEYWYINTDHISEEVEIVVRLE